LLRDEIERLRVCSGSAVFVLVERCYRVDLVVAQVEVEDFEVLAVDSFGGNYYSTAGCGNYVPFKTPAPR
jgi:hypothetical protein